MHFSIKIFGIIIALIVLNEFIQGVIRQNERYEIFKMAQVRAQETNRKLLVVGDPYYGYGSKFYSIFMKNYECGDVTVDLTGAPKCSNGVKADILSFLKNQPSDSLVIFISCVLEYVDNIEEVISEINRVAGNRDNIFVVTVCKYSLSAFIYRDAHSKSKNIIYAPPLYDIITYSKIKK
jgi:hypothetical protein